MDHSPVTILGAGPAGCTAALALSARGIACRMLDQATFPRDKICGDALSGKVVMALKRIDPNLAGELGAQAFTHPSHGVVFVAPNGKALRVPFRRTLDTAQPPGFLARRKDFDNWLFEKASAAPGVSCTTGVRVDTFRREGSQWIIGNKENTFALRTSLILAADGAQSRFAKQVGGMEMEDEHYCAGLRVYYKGVKDLDPNGFIELHFVKDFLPGYFWIFPLAGGAANVGVGMRSDVARKHKINLKEAMNELIRTYEPIRRRFADAVAEGPVNGYGLPLGSRKRALSGEGFLLLGDAGALIDPFTGEGIGNAMISGIKAAETIVEAAGDFSASSLLRYDESVYKRLWPELSLSKTMQQLVGQPWLFNMVVNKASRSKTLQETISCMFEDLDLRGRLKDPRFYLKVLFE